MYIYIYIRRCRWHFDIHIYAYSFIYILGRQHDFLQHDHPISHGREFQRHHARPHRRAGLHILSYFDTDVYMYLFVYMYF